MKRPIRILVVDRDLSTLDLCNAARAQGLSASITLSDSGSAMNCFAALAPDLVLLEIVMPEIDGIELLMAIKQQHPATQVVATSAGGAYLPRDTVLYWASRLGADAVLRKPFDAAELQKVLYGAFSGQLQIGQTQD